MPVSCNSGGARSIRKVPILVYHHVYPEDAPELLSATHETGAGIIGRADFIRQMEYIRDQGWCVVSTSTVVDWLLGGESPPEKAVVVHFDNGWLDTATVALPALQALAFTATCFLITDGVEAASRGEAATVRTHTEGVVERPFMNWPGV